ncbi:MAG: DUF4347 domain-containing protein, partial [Ignavibacteriales bacterium]
MASDGEGEKRGKLPKGVKRPKPSAIALEPRFVFDAAIGAEIMSVVAPKAMPDVFERSVAEQAGRLTWSSTASPLLDRFVGSQAPAQEQLVHETANPLTQLVTQDGHKVLPQDVRAALIDGLNNELARFWNGDARSLRDYLQTHTWQEALNRIVDHAAQRDQTDQPTTLYVIDSRVKDLDTITSKLPEGSYLVLDPTKDGIDQVTDFLNGRTGVSTLTFITDGEPGAIELGSTMFDDATLLSHADEVASWRASLSDNADILILGCDVAKDGAGDAFLNHLSDITGADVAASTDKTGAGNLGGDLVLETQIGAIEQSSLDSVHVLDGYRDVLTLSAISLVDANGGNLTTADIASGMSFNVSANNAQNDGNYILVEVKSGSTLVYWQVFQNTSIPNGNTTPVAMTLTTIGAPLGSLPTGALTVEFYQGKVGTASNSGAYAGSAKTAPTASQFTAITTLQSISVNYSTVSGNSAPTVVSVTNPSGQTEATDASAQDIPAISGTMVVNDIDSGQTLTGSVTGNATATYSGGSLPGGVDVSALISSGAISFTNTATSDGTNKTLNWTYNPAAANLDWLKAGETLTITYTARVSDGTANSSTTSLTITITGTNDAPVLDATKSPILTSVGQTGGAPSGAVGTLVSALVTGGVTDKDNSTSPGIAITATNATKGTWWYSTNGGSTWTAVGSVSDTSALLLGPTARLYFQPNGTYSGTVSDAITIRAWDRSSGTEGTKVTTASTGGTTAFSTATDTAAISVKPAYSLSSPDSAFAQLLVGNRFDPHDDTQSNAADTDLYGQNGTPLLLGAYDSTANDLYFRVRINDPTMSKGTPVFTGVLLMGIDVNGDGKLDVFVGVDGRNNGLGVVTFAPGSGLNISPSTTSITAEQSVAGGSTPATSGYYTYTLTGDDLGGDG